jgi:hypothetical protein
MLKPSPAAMPDTRSVNYYAASTVLPVVLRRWLCGQALSFTEDACRRLGSLAANELEDAAAMIVILPNCILITKGASASMKLSFIQLGKRLLMLPTVNSALPR